MTKFQEAQIALAIEYAKDHYDMSGGKINWCNVSTLAEFDELIVALHDICNN